MITLDYSTSYRSVTHTQAYFSSLVTDIVSIADLKPITKEPTIHLVDENGNPYTVQGSVTFYGHFNGGVDSYVPTSQYVYRVDGTLGIGIRLNYHAPEFPDINDYVADSYSSIAAYSAAALNWGKAVENWYASVEAGEITEAAIGDTGGIVASVKSDTPIKIGNLMQALDASALKIVGSAFDDVIEGRGSQSNEIDGGAGNDAITVLSNGSNNIKGGTGDDTIVITGSGISTIDAGDGDDNIDGGDGDDNIDGGDGSDVLDGGAGSDSLDGGGGFDIATYGSSTVPIRSFEGDTITNVELVVGSRFDDEFAMNQFNRAMGNGGSDTIVGTDSDDVIFGDGDNSITTIIALKAPINGQQLLDANVGGVAGSDWLYGGRGSDVLFGGGGNDHLFAGVNDAIIFTTSDNAPNTLNGEEGDDELNAWTFSGSISDYLAGGTGRDTYFADGTDIVRELEVGETAYYRTNFDPGRVLISHYGFNSTLVTFFGNSENEYEQLRIENNILKSDLVVDELSFGGIHAVKITRAVDSEPIIKGEMAAAIWQEYTVDQFKLVAKYLLDKLVLGGRSKQIAESAVQKLAPYLVGAGATELEKAAFNKVVGGAIEEALNTGAQNIATADTTKPPEILSAGDIAEIVAKVLLYPEAKVLKESLDVGVLLTKLVWNAAAAELKLALNNWFGPNGDGEFVLRKAQEGYLEGSTVFSDVNGNGELDDGEQFTTTERDGTFVLDGPPSQIIAQGGVDTSTGLPFKGYLAAPSGSTFITPLTTLVALLSADALAEQKVLASFRLSSSIDLTTFDPIAAAKAGSVDGVLAYIAQAKVYDTGSLIASTLVAAGGEFLSGVKAAFAAIAAAIGGSGISLTNEAHVSALVTASAQAEGLALGQGVADSVAAIIVASNTLLDQKAQSGATGDALLNSIAAIERVVQGTASNAVQQAGNDPDQLQALVDAFTGENLNEAVSTALEHLGTADTTAPTLTPVADQTNEATSAAGAAAFFTATAIDDVDGALPIVFKEGNTVVHSGDTFGLGSHTITASTIDAAGNISSDTFTIDVVDTTGPTLAPIVDQVFEATSATGAAAFFAATATDLVDGTAPVVFREGSTVVLSGDNFSFGTHTITATAVDAAGNQTSQNFKFNVVDTTAPTLTPVANQTREATSAAGAAAFFAATALDLVDGFASVVFKEGSTVVSSGDIFGLGTHTITASTTDAAGNLASETFTINVRDTTAPTLTPIADQTLQATTAAGAAAFFSTTATDLVDGTNPVVFTEGDRVVRSGDIFGVGTHTITATAVDAAGNSSTDVFEINVLGLASSNHDPVAIDDSKGVAKGKSLSVSANKGVLSNDRDADHDHLSVGSVNGSAANVGHFIKGDYGTLTLNADGSYSYVATAKALPSEIFAQDTFTYTTFDGQGGSGTATLTFSVFDPSFNYKAGSNTILWGGNGKDVLDGSGGHNLIYGGNGADVLIGGNGNILAGGKGADQFVFRPDFGFNTILDFDVKNDYLQFDDSTFQSVKSILDHTTNTALGALISDGHGDSVLLLGVNKSQLMAHSNDLLIG